MAEPEQGLTPSDIRTHLKNIFVMRLSEKFNGKEAGAKGPEAWWFHVEDFLHR